MSDFYTFEATPLHGGPAISLERYQGKYVLIVNTASQCGFTPQYAGLELLYRKYKHRGLVVIGFPCNQFGGQEPGDAQEIAAFCRVNFEVSFPMFEKIEVNGDNAHPLFRYLKSELKGLLGGKIKWNFTKFLVGPDGVPLKRFGPTDSPEKIEKYLANLMPAR